MGWYLDYEAAYQMTKRSSWYSNSPAHIRLGFGLSFLLATVLHVVFFMRKGSLSDLYLKWQQCMVKMQISGLL